MSTPRLSRALGCGLALVCWLHVPTASMGSDYRLRIAPDASAPGGSTDAVLEQVVGTVGSLEVDHGIRLVPAVTAPVAARLDTRLRDGFTARSASPDPGGLLSELGRWARFSVADADRARVLAALDADPRVERIEEVLTAELCGFVPDEPYLANQQVWLDLVGLPDAWAAANETNVIPARVAIVDGGTDWLHPDLLANVASNDLEVADDGIDQDANGFVDDVRGWNFAAGHGDPSPVPGLVFSGRHGTHVAGLVGAVIGNGVGVAGAGGNPELILVNASHPEVDGGIAYGYEGILYALTRDADIINCSWRTVRKLSAFASDAPYSEFEALVLRLAREAGALVIGATGNDFDPDLWTTPAGYPDCFAVSATANSETIPWVGSNLGAWVDLMAPGQFMISTFPRDTPGSLGPYGLLSGTSMAAALTSGIAALVAGQHPEWDSEQLRSRLRWTGEYHEELGLVPFLRADAALASTVRHDLRIEVGELVDQDGDGLIEGGETTDLTFSIQAVFAPQTSVQIEAITDDPWLTPLIERVSAPSVGVGQALEFQRGLKFWVHPAAPPGHIAQIQLRAIVDGVAGPLSSGPVVLRSLSAYLDGAVLQAAASANGVLGEATQVVSRRVHRPALGRAGEEFAYLQRAALLLGRSTDQVSDALLSRDPESPFKDFRALQDGLERLTTDEGGQEIVARFSDRSSPDGLGINVEQRMILPARPGWDDFVFVEYTFTAVDAMAPDLRWGLALDWSVPGSVPGSAYVAERLVSLDGARGVRVEAAEPGEGAGVAGMQVIEGGSSPGLGSLREWASEEEAGWNLPGRYRSTVTDSLLWTLMAPGEGESLDRTGGRVAVLSAGLGDLDRGETRRIVVAMAVAADADELESRLDRARVAWEAQQAGLDPAELEDSLLRFSRNPFRSGTELSFSLGRPGPVQVTVFDLRGRLVRGLLDAHREAGVHQVSWNGLDQSGRAVASGVYFVRLSTPSATRTLRVTRVR